jgi:peroxiredoxin
MAERALSDILEETFVRCRDLDVPLADRLQAFADEVRRMGPHFAVAVDNLVARLMETGAGTTAPKVGDPMPPFLLPDEQGRLVGLEDLLGEGPVAIAFHRGYWCPYCRINANALARVEKEIAPERRHVAAVVPDRQKYTTWLKGDAGAPFPILTDVDSGYAATIDLAIWVGDEMKQLMVSSGWNPAVSQGTENWLLPIPATFIVGTDGIITARFVDPDYRMRMAIEDLVAALRKAK